MKQMTEITNVGAIRFQTILELTNVKLQHAVLDGCGDPRVSLQVDLFSENIYCDHTSMQHTILVGTWSP